MKKIVITGEFDEDDMMQLLETVRRIERRRPDVTYILSADAYELSEDEALAAVRRIFPKLPGEEPITGVIRREKEDGGTGTCGDSGERRQS